MNQYTENENDFSGNNNDVSADNEASIYNSNNSVLSSTYTTARQAAAARITSVVVSKEIYMSEWKKHLVILGKSFNGISLYLVDINTNVINAKLYLDLVSQVL